MPASESYTHNHKRLHIGTGKTEGRGILRTEYSVLADESECRDHGDRAQRTPVQHELPCPNFVCKHPKRREEHRRLTALLSLGLDLTEIGQGAFQFVTEMFEFEHCFNAGQ